MQVVHTPGLPPNQGRMYFPMSGWTWKRRKAPAKIVRAKAGMEEWVGIAERGARLGNAKSREGRKNRAGVAVRRWAAHRVRDPPKTTRLLARRPSPRLQAYFMHRILFL